MKLYEMPIFCPACGDVLINQYIERADGTQKLEKYCKSRPSHNITWVSLIPNHKIIDITWILLQPTIKVIWYYQLDIIRYDVLGKKDLSIPFFEPDFTNYNKLIDKLKTYILFS